MTNRSRDCGGVVPVRCGQPHDVGGYRCRGPSDLVGNVLGQVEEFACARLHGHSQFTGQDFGKAVDGVHEELLASGT